MKKAVILLLAAMAAFSQPVVRQPDETTVSALPAASGATRKIYIVTDGANATDCSTGGGSSRVVCISNGSAYVATGGAGGSITDTVSISTTPTTITLAAGAQVVAGNVPSTFSGPCTVTVSSGTGTIFFYYSSAGQWLAGGNVTASASGCSAAFVSAISAYPAGSIPLASVAVTAGVPGAITKPDLTARRGAPILAGTGTTVTYDAQGAATIAATGGSTVSKSGQYLLIGSDYYLPSFAGLPLATLPPSSGWTNPAGRNTGSPTFNTVSGARQMLDNSGFGASKGGCEYVALTANTLTVALNPSALSNIDFNWRTYIGVFARYGSGATDWEELRWYARDDSTDFAPFWTAEGGDSSSYNLGKLNKFPIAIGAAAPLIRFTAATNSLAIAISPDGGVTWSTLAEPSVTGLPTDWGWCAYSGNTKVGVAYLLSFKQE